MLPCCSFIKLLHGCNPSAPFPHHPPGFVGRRNFRLSQFDLWAKLF